MNKQTFMNKVAPFLVLGTGIAIAVVLMVFFFYLFVGGAIIGLILYGAFYLKQKFWGPSPSESITRHSKGRIIEHDEKE